jgi:hypothetical protein
MKLNVKAFGVAAGILWGACAFIFGLWGMFYAPAGAVVAFLGDFYLGYAATFVGSLIGFVWGFLDAGIGGLVGAWLYNRLVDTFKAA